MPDADDFIVWRRPRQCGQRTRRQTVLLSPATSHPTASLADCPDCRSFYGPRRSRCVRGDHGVSFVVSCWPKLIKSNRIYHAQHIHCITRGRWWPAPQFGETGRPGRAGQGRAGRDRPDENRRRTTGSPADVIVSRAKGQLSYSSCRRAVVALDRDDRFGKL